ncbi:MAG: hypothetical protein JXR12_06715 [Neptunomonas phycophila]|uniref:hypothetical protein n=1 Tax=Neptunomonas phycophila TaxID=1572645 RepID=UPI003B8C74B9
MANKDTFYTIQTQPGKFVGSDGRRAMKMRNFKRYPSAQAAQTVIDSFNAKGANSPYAVAVSVTAQEHSEKSYQHWQVKRIEVSYEIYSE